MLKKYVLLSLLLVTSSTLICKTPVRSETNRRGGQTRNYEYHKTHGPAFNPDIEEQNIANRIGKQSPIISPHYTNSRHAELVQLSEQLLQIANKLHTHVTSTPHQQ